MRLDGKPLTIRVSPLDWADVTDVVSVQLYVGDADSRALDLVCDLTLRLGLLLAQQGRLGPDVGLPLLADLLSRVAIEDVPEGLDHEGPLLLVVESDRAPLGARYRRTATGLSAHGRRLEPHRLLMKAWPSSKHLGPWCAVVFALATPECAQLQSWESVPLRAVLASDEAGFESLQSDGRLPIRLLLLPPAEGGGLNDRRQLAEALEVCAQQRPLFVAMDVGRGTAGASVDAERTLDLAVARARQARVPIATGVHGSPRALRTRSSAPPREGTLDLCEEIRDMTSLNLVSFAPRAGRRTSLFRVGRVLRAGEQSLDPSLSCVPSTGAPPWMPTLGLWMARRLQEAQSGARVVTFQSVPGEDWWAPLRVPSWLADGAAATERVARGWVEGNDAQTLCAAAAADEAGVLIAYEDWETPGPRRGDEDLHAVWVQGGGGGRPLVPGPRLHVAQALSLVGGEGVFPLDAYALDHLVCEQSQGECVAPAPGLLSFGVLALWFWTVAELAGRAGGALLAASGRLRWGLALIPLGSVSYWLVVRSLGVAPPLLASVVLAAIVFMSLVIQQLRDGER